MIINPYAFGQSYDPDAQAVITAIESTGVTLTTTQKNACNQLIVDLKGFGIWSKMKALYGFLGGTAGAHKWNWKNPSDTDAAFRLVFNGGWTHSNQGTQANGINGYGDTFLVPSAQYAVDNNHHVSVYSRLNQTQNDADLGCYDATRALQLRIFFTNGTEFYSNNFTPVNPTDTNSVGNYNHISVYSRLNQTQNDADLGAYDAIRALQLRIFYNPGAGAGTEFYSNNFLPVNPADTNSVGNYIANRIGTAVKIFKNNTTLGSFTNAANGRPTFSLFLACTNASGTPNSGLYSNKQYAFSSIGDGLTDTEAANFYTAVQAYNTTLSRQV